jgi:uncharacterized protein YjbJ (UPF0337 family)
MTINKDQIQGRVDAATGAVKEAAGKLVGNPTLQVKGRIEKNVGNTQAALGDIRNDLKKLQE